MTASKRRQHAQCINCGHIYQTEKVNIDDIYINHKCPRCESNRGLNVGNDILDLYMYYDMTKDERYYN